MTPPAPSDASALCLSCGICCEGVLHDHAVSYPEEAERLRALRLPLYEGDVDYPAFKLPCRHHCGGKCTVYERRPSVCGTYQCSLLKAVINEEKSLEEGLEIVRRVRTLMSAIYAIIGARDPSVRIWSQARAYLREKHLKAPDEVAFRSENAQLLLSQNALALLCGRHFQASCFPKAWNWDDAPTTAEEAPVPLAPVEEQETPTP